MKIQIDTQVGRSKLTFWVEDEKAVDALYLASQCTTIPKLCGLCKSEDVELKGNKAQGFTFVKVKCNKCQGFSQLGQFKDGSGFFWKEFEVYVVPTNEGAHVNK